ncbi:hypothetical protein LXL04_008340 [Taraxacum kok-saghyz]
MIMESMTNDVDATKNVLARELWREYEDNASLEANLVKDFDKVEMILQALEYETCMFWSRKKKEEKLIKFIMVTFLKKLSFNVNSILRLWYNIFLLQMSFSSRQLVSGLIFTFSPIKPSICHFVSICQWVFFGCTAGKFQTEIGKSWAAEINSRRNSRLAKKLN